MDFFCGENSSLIASGIGGGTYNCRFPSYALNHLKKKYGEIIKFYSVCATVIYSRFSRGDTHANWVFQNARSFHKQGRNNDTKTSTEYLESPGYSLLSHDCINTGPSILRDTLYVKYCQNRHNNSDHQGVSYILFLMAFFSLRC